MAGATTPNLAPDRARRRAAIALAVFGVAAATAYVAQRLFDWATTGPIDPLLVLRETHVAYYWRAFVATWWGGTIGGIAWASAGSDERIDRIERVLGWSVIPWAVALGIASRVWP